MKRSLILGTGFIGGELALAIRRSGREVIQSSRTTGRSDIAIGDRTALDHLLDSQHFEQIVVVGQLASPSIDWVLDRIDGPRWLVLSSLQVLSAIPSPQSRHAVEQEQSALDRGACVLRPSMVYGRGGDQSVTRLIRFLGRFRLSILPGDGSQQVQPLHVDDLCTLIMSHSRGIIGGLFPVGGPEAVPLRELVWIICEVLGIPRVTVRVPSSAIRLAALAAPCVGLRPDQFLRLTEPKTVDIARTAKAFDWEPLALGLRLEQACREVGDSS